MYIVTVTMDIVWNKRDDDDDDDNNGKLKLCGELNTILIVHVNIK